MLKIPRQFSIRNNSPQSNSGSLDSSIDENPDENPDEVLTLTSLDDIERVTNAIEPEQQRGPSEYP